jgi:hypothetical protein
LYQKVLESKHLLNDQLTFTELIDYMKKDKQQQNINNVNSSTESLLMNTKNDIFKNLIKTDFSFILKNTIYDTQYFSLYNNHDYPLTDFYKHFSNIVEKKKDTDLFLNWIMIYYSTTKNYNNIHNDLSMKISHDLFGKFYEKYKKDIIDISDKSDDLNIDELLKSKSKYKNYYERDKSGIKVNVQSQNLNNGNGANKKEIYIERDLNCVINEFINNEYIIDNFFTDFSEICKMEQYKNMKNKDTTMMKNETRNNYLNETTHDFNSKLFDKYKSNVNENIYKHNSENSILLETFINFNNTKRSLKNILHYYFNSLNTSNHGGNYEEFIIESVQTFYLSIYECINKKFSQDANKFEIQMLLKDLNKRLLYYQENNLKDKKCNNKKLNEIKNDIDELNHKINITKPDINMNVIMEYVKHNLGIQLYDTSKNWYLNRFTSFINEIERYKIYKKYENEKKLKYDQHFNQKDEILKNVESINNTINNTEIIFYSPFLFNDSTERDYKFIKKLEITNTNSVVNLLKTNDNNFLKENDSELTGSHNFQKHKLFSNDIPCYEYETILDETIFYDCDTIDTLEEPYTLEDYKYQSIDFETYDEFFTSIFTIVNNSTNG